MQLDIAIPPDGEHAHDAKVNSKTDRLWINALVGFFFLSSLVWFSQQINFGFASASGLAVPDSVNLTLTMQELWTHYRLFDPKSGYWAIAVLYGWTWLVHPVLCFAVNGVLMLANAAVFKRVVLVRLGAPPWSILGLLANPYLILAMPGPNKEIPLLLLTLLVTDALLKPDRRWWLAVALCIPIYALRDGYGLIMLFWVGVTWLLVRHERLLPIFVLVMTTATAVLWLPLSLLIPAMARNMSIYNALFEHQEAIGSVAASLAIDPFSPLGGPILYVIRLVYNLVSMAFFPIFATNDGHFYWIGLAYWIYGLMVLMSLIGCAWEWMAGSGARSLKLAASLALCMWFMVSLSLFVQPRYLMPVLPIAFGVLATLPARSRLCSISLAIGIALTVMSAYALTGRSAPPATPELLCPPAYLVVISHQDTH